MKIVWTSALLVLPLVACSSTEPPPIAPQPEITWDQVDTADGETLYGSLCASCHGLSGAGDGPVADQLTIEIPDLRTLSARNGGKFPRDRIQDLIYGAQVPAAHGGAMPVWGPAIQGTFDHHPHVDSEAFALHRVRRITRYLESLQTD